VSPLQHGVSRAFVRVEQEDFRSSKDTAPIPRLSLGRERRAAGALSNQAMKAALASVAAKHKARIATTLPSDIDSGTGPRVAVSVGRFSKSISLPMGSPRLATAEQGDGLGAARET